MGFMEIEYRERNREWNMASLHSHEYYEIYCLLEGTRNLFFESKTFVLRKGSIVVIPPSCIHRTEGGAYKRINLYISPSELSEAERIFLDECFQMTAFELRDDDKQRFFSVLESLASAQNPFSLQKAYVLHLIKTLLYLLRTSERMPLPEALITPIEKTKDEAIMGVVSYINEHYRERITLDGLSDIFFVSKNTLCRNFHKVMKCSVMEYCSVVRFNMAKHLLVTTPKTITEIAELCGFSSANYFSLIFKQSIGISPREYRKKQ